MDSVEKQYTPSLWCYRRCDPGSVIQKHVETVARVKKELHGILNVKYGVGPNQKCDIFEPANKCSEIPTFIYIHGGYWQELDKDISSYCIKPLIQAGIRVIIPGYDLAPNISLQEIINEIETLARYVQIMAKEQFWGKIWYSGHSAGAHLAACLLCSPFLSQFNITGFVLISGIYNVEPLIQTTINNNLNITNENFATLSPLHNIQNIQTSSKPQVLLIVGEFDPPAFHNQLDIFKEELERLQIPVTKHIIPGTDHFTVVENLSENDYTLTTIIIKQLKNNKHYQEYYIH